MSAGALAAGYYLYQYGKLQLGLGQKVGENPQDGLNQYKGDPLWPEPGSSPSTQRPSCEMWNDEYQVFVNAGSTTLDNNMTACLTYWLGEERVRYVDQDGVLHFDRNDPLKEPTSEHGTCYLWNGQTDSTFPDVGGLNPVNRSARLCFAADVQGLTPHYFIRKSDSRMTFSPQLNAGHSSFPWISGLVDRNFATEPQQGGFCEEDAYFKGYGSSVSNAHGWTMTDVSSTAKDVTSCLNLNKGLPTRWVDREQGKYVFQAWTGGSIVTKDIAEDAMWNS